jgi:hypothetical protein
MEKSYRQISLKEAARILYLNQPDDLAEIARKVSERRRRKKTKFFI